MMLPLFCLSPVNTETGCKERGGEDAGPASQRKLKEIFGKGGGDAWPNPKPLDVSHESEAPVMPKSRASNISPEGVAAHVRQLHEEGRFLVDKTNLENSQQWLDVVPQTVQALEFFDTIPQEYWVYVLRSLYNHVAEKLYPAPSTGKQLSERRLLRQFPKDERSNVKRINKKSDR
jgi:hypothetical protein